MVGLYSDLRGDPLTGRNTLWEILCGEKGEWGAWRELQSLLWMIGSLEAFGEKVRKCSLRRKVYAKNRRLEPSAPQLGSGWGDFVELRRCSWQGSQVVYPGLCCHRELHTELWCGLWYICNPSTWGAEEERLQVWDHPGMPSEALPTNKTTEKPWVIGERLEICAKYLKEVQYLQ